MSLSGLILMIFPVPIMNILIPLIMYKTKKGMTKDEKRLSISILNYQITWSVIYLFVILISMLLSSGIFSELFQGFPMIGYFLLFFGAFWVLINVLISIITAVRINQNKSDWKKPKYSLTS